MTRQKLHEAITTAPAPPIIIYPMGNKKTSTLKADHVRLFLKAWRDYRGLTQEELAFKIGTTKASISRVESGKQNWDQKFLGLACQALDCKPLDLISRDPSESAELWTIWDAMAPPEKEQIFEIAKTFRRS